MADQTKLDRLVEIQKEIADLTREGMGIADSEQVTFDLSEAAFTNNYGSGGLEYYPKGDEPYIDEYGDEVTVFGDSVRGQWMSSNSWGC